MIAGLEAVELFELALLLIAVGALAGFLAGVFGIGGGAILVPVFYECFRLAGVPLEVRMPLCIGTSLAIIIPTSIMSFRAHHARGAVDLKVLREWWLPILIGVLAGTLTARYAPERLFKIVFVLVAWSAAARLLLARATWKLGDNLPDGPIMKAYGFMVGLLSTLMGIGGGLFANLLIGAVLVMPTSLLVAPLGVRAAHAMSKRTLETAFGIYLFMVGCRFAISLL